MSRRTALVIIDMQRIFRDADSQWCCGGYDDAAERVRSLAEQFAGRVVWTRFVRDPAETGAWKDYYERWGRCREPEDSPAWDITLPMAEGDRIISLPTFSKWGDELAEATRDCERLILCGVATDCCVLSTVLGAVDAGKWVTVVTDACAGATDRAHEQALELMRLLSPMVTLATADELTAENGSED